MGNTESSDTLCIPMCPDPNAAEKLVELEDLSISLVVDHENNEQVGLRSAVSGPDEEQQHLRCIGIPVYGQSELSDHSILGVFTGEKGDYKTQYLADHFLQVFAQRPELITYSSLPEGDDESSGGRDHVYGEVLLRQAIVKTFNQIMDEILEKERASRGKIVLIDGQNGCSVNPIHEIKRSDLSVPTAVIVLLTPSHIICAKPNKEDVKEDKQ